MLPGFATINHSADDLDGAKRWHAELVGISRTSRGRDAAGRPVYAEFRIGGHAEELGLADRR